MGSKNGKHGHVTILSLTLFWEKIPCPEINSSSTKDNSSQNMEFHTFPSIYCFYIWRTSAEAVYRPILQSCHALIRGPFWNPSVGLIIDLRDHRPTNLAASLSRAPILSFVCYCVCHCQLE